MPQCFASAFAILALVTITMGALLTPNGARADNLIDHRLSKDTGGIYQDTGGIYQLQDAVPITLALLTAGCALWEGTENRLGKTCWEGGESGAASRPRRTFLAESAVLMTRRSKQVWPDET